MTSSGPISIAPIAPGDGEAAGIGMFMLDSGDGEAAGIGIPGVCRWGVPDGDGAGVAAGVGLGFDVGIWWP